MKILSAALLAALLATSVALAAPSTTVPSITGSIITNDASTGTTINKLAKINSGGNAVISGTSDTDGALGVVLSDAGTTGSAQIASSGVVKCAFDGTATAGHYVQISSSVAGDCHDTGSATRPTSGGQIIGIVKAGGSGAATYTLQLQLGNQGFNNGTVTSVGVAGILTGGPITGSGTLNVNATITPQGRLTLTSAAPVMTGNVSGATSVLYTPYMGNLIPIYDGTNMVPTAFSELSNVNANSSTGSAGPAAVAASSCYDYFVWSNSGTPTLTRGPVWTNTTTRSAGTALTRVNGIQLNNASITNGPAASRGTYVGTACSNTGSNFDWNTGGAASGGTAGTLMVWNMYNRVLVSATVTDNGATYTYASGTIRQARASAGNQVTGVLGLAEDSIIATYGARVNITNVIGAAAAWGVGVDSTNSFQCQPNFGGNVVNSSTAPFASANTCTISPQLGQHVFSANEQSDGSNSNTFDGALVNSFGAQVRM